MKEALRDALIPCLGDFLPLTAEESVNQTCEREAVQNIARTICTTLGIERYMVDVDELTAFNCYCDGLPEKFRPCLAHKVADILTALLDLAKGDT